MRTYRHRENPARTCSAPADSRFAPGPRHNSSAPIATQPLPSATKPQHRTAKYQSLSAFSSPRLDFSLPAFRLRHIIQDARPVMPSSSPEAGFGERRALFSRSLPLHPAWGLRCASTLSLRSHASLRPLPPSLQHLFGTSARAGGAPGLTIDLPMEPAS